MTRGCQESSIDARMLAMLRTLRTAKGWSQAELAARAGVSRQLVGAVEAGRHLPRVDAAIGMAGALGVSVTELFHRDGRPVDVLTGVPVSEGTSVRVGVVGDTVAASPARSRGHGWVAADGIVIDGRLERFGPRGDGVVVAGCEPGLAILEETLRTRGASALAVAASSRAAVDALAAGRLHAAAVHAPPGSREVLSHGLPEVVRVHIASWQVGLSAPRESAPGWADRAVSGGGPVIQREVGAGVQTTFESALRPGSTPIEGPRVGSHVEAAQLCAATGLPAVTIEPAAVAVGVAFHPIEVHDVELWVDRRWIGAGAVRDALDVLTSTRFVQQLQAIGGYDVSDLGVTLP